jgi:hypothetical protein
MAAMEGKVMGLTGPLRAGEEEEQDELRGEPVAVVMVPMAA